MAATMRFGEVLEAVDQLSVEDQEALAEIPRRRLAEQGRKRVLADVEDGRREFAAGNGRRVSVDELMDEILSSPRHSKGAVNS